jgi:hypothetical protein
MICFPSFKFRFVLKRHQNLIFCNRQSFLSRVLWRFIFCVYIFLEFVGAIASNGIAALGIAALLASVFLKGDETALFGATKTVGDI